MEPKGRGAWWVKAHEYRGLASKELGPRCGFPLTDEQSPCGRLWKSSAVALEKNDSRPGRGDPDYRLENLQLFETLPRVETCRIKYLENAGCICLINSSQRKTSYLLAAQGFLSHTGQVRHLGYTRVSTSSQDAALQFDALAAAGVQKRDVFADVTSGSRSAIERPGMKKLLEYAQSGDTVVVWRVDRLGRSLIDVLNTVNLLRERGVNVRSISDGIDPATSTGRMMLNMLASLAEYERELIVERVNAGIAAARQSGTRFGRPVSDPAVIADKLAIAKDARARGRTAEDAARLVGWSRATFYRHLGQESASVKSL